MFINDLDEHGACMLTTSVDDIKLPGYLICWMKVSPHLSLLKKVTSTSWDGPTATRFNLLGINVKSCHWVQKVNGTASCEIRTWGMWLTTIQ